MIISEDFVKQTFDWANRLFFHAALQPVEIRLGRARRQLGSCACRTIRTGIFSLSATRVFTLHFSQAFDLPKEVWEDVVIHEMIHYHIGYNRLSDTSPHGETFRSLMDEINGRYGRHIQVSYRETASVPAKATEVRHRYHVIAVVNFSDGRRGIKVLPRILQRITKYYNLMLLSSDIDSIDLYMSCDPFFGRYPNSGALKVYAIDPSDLKEHLRDASGMKCDGATVEIFK